MAIQSHSPDVVTHCFGAFFYSLVNPVLSCQIWVVQLHRSGLALAPEVIIPPFAVPRGWKRAGIAASSTLRWGAGEGQFPRFGEVFSEEPLGFGGVERAAAVGLRAEFGSW